jgi:hypothetical protein
MVRNLPMVSGKLGQTSYKKNQNQNVTMVLEFCMQRNCCCNERIAVLRNLLKYPWAWEHIVHIVHVRSDRHKFATSQNIVSRVIILKISLQIFQANSNFK